MLSNIVHASMNTIYDPSARQQTTWENKDFAANASVSEIVSMSLELL